MNKTVRFFLVLALALAAVVGLQGQLGLSPTSFSPGQTISSATFTQLMTNISNLSCNRTGCTMTGNVLFSPDNALDLGAAGNSRPRDLHVGRNGLIGGTLGVTGTSTLAALSATTGTFSSTLGVTGATTLGSTLGVTGTSTLAALNATAGTFSSTITGNGNLRLTAGSYMRPDDAGAAMTLGNGTNNLFDTQLILSGLGAFLAQIDANGMLLRNASAFSAQNTAVATVNLATVTGANTPFFGPTDGQASGGCCTATVLNGPALTFRANGADRTTISSTGTLTHAGAVALTGVISPAALSGDAPVDWAPTGLSTAFVVRVTPLDGGSSMGTLAAQPAGSMKAICNVSLPGDLDPLTITGGISGTAANRFTALRVIPGGECAWIIYDGTSSRWRPFGETS